MNSITYPHFVCFTPYFVCFTPSTTQNLILLHTILILDKMNDIPYNSLMRKNKYLKILLYGQQLNSFQNFLNAQNQEKVSNAGNDNTMPSLRIT